MSALVPLQEFIPALSPRFASPLHLRPLTDIFERIRAGESVRAVTSLPPRRGKTETILHSIPWLLLDDPERQIIYASYAGRISESKSRRARTLAERAGVPIAQDSRSRQNWRTGVGEGAVWATGIDGSVTGEGCHVLIVDDPHKGRAEAESANIRDRTYDTFKGDFMTRLEPGAAVLVNGTRWHPEDLPGRLIDEGWEFVNLPAITESGESLWPERWPIEQVLRTREELGGPDGYEWTSLYMGQPRGRGSRVFGDVQTYDLLPEVMRITIGFDFAYSTKTSADFSVAIVLGSAGGNHFVLDVLRVRLEPRDFRARVKLLLGSYPNASACAYAASTEAGAIEFLRDGGIAVQGWTATTDKFTRAIPVAAAWNSGKIFLPRFASWLDAFVSEVCGFTGVKDRHDDQVDALAAAFDHANHGARVSNAYSKARAGYRAARAARPHGHVGDGQWHELAPNDFTRRRSARERF